ncbi:MAG: S9 family peptidase [Candidatus Limimorpha sp.]
MEENMASKVKNYTVQEFFRNSEKIQYRISPNGEYYSFMAPYMNRLNVYVQSVKGGEPTRITSETDRNISEHAWVNNERIVFLKDNGGDENFQLFGVNRDGSDFKAYTAIPNVVTQIIDILKDNEQEILIATNERQNQIFDLYRLNLKTGEKQLICENPGNIQGYKTDHNGKVRIAYTIEDGVNTSILYRDSEDECFRKIITTNYKDEINIVGFTPDNQYVYAFSNINRDKSALVLMNPTTCEEIETLYSNPTYDCSGLSYSEARNKLLAVSCIGHKETTRHYFDDDFRMTVNLIADLLPKSYNYNIIDWDKSENTMIVFAYSDRNPGSYYIFKKQSGSDGMSGTLEKIADTRPWLKEEEMGNMLPVEYTSRDGLRIESYLTLPCGFTMETAKNMPVIINPHGGPWARDVWRYNSETQFLANRGYAVLQMNFRGSTGYGRKFKELSYKQWGQTMQDDITDGVMWLINNGIADKDRIAIYGGSYGGYATLCGITKTPDLYACAIDYVGVSNLFTFMSTIPPYWEPLLKMMYDMVGNPEEDHEMMKTNSPIFNVDKIKTPLFIAQGKNDPRVNKNESDQMVEALRKRGIDVDYMVKDNEGHGFSNEENKFEFYNAMELFLKKHLNREIKM